MANMPEDPNYGIETPEDVENAQEKDYELSANPRYGATSGSQAFAGGTMLGRMLFGNRRLEQAQSTQQALGNAVSDSDVNAPEDEDGLAASLRRLKAAYTAVAPVNPQAALQITNRLAVLQEAQNQQKRLAAQTEQETASAKYRNDQDALDLAQKGTMIVGSADGLKQYGSVRLFDDQGKLRSDWQQEVDRIKADSNDPNAVQVQQDRWFANKLAQAQLRGQLALQQAANKQAAGTQLTEGGLRQLAARSAIFGESVLARQDQNTRNAVMNFKAENGINPDDEVAARAQLKALYANANAQGRREGNVDYLGASVTGLGQQVLQTLNGVTRTNLQPLNALIAAGKQATGDAGEARYSAAIQNFVQEYSRVINGGTGQTTDSARREALEMLNHAQSPEQVKAVMQQLTQKELAVLKNATPTAVEALRNPQLYRAVLKIQKAAGIPLAPDDGSEAGPAAPAAPATAGGPAGGRVAPPEAIAALRANPSLAPQFKAYYGYLPTIGNTPSSQTAGSGASGSY